MRCDNIIILHGISISLFVASLHEIAREGDGTSQPKLPIQRHQIRGYVPKESVVLRRCGVLQIIWFYQLG